MERRRRAVVRVRPQRLVEPLPLHARHRHRDHGARGRRDRRAALAVRGGALRPAARRFGGVRAPAPRVRRARPRAPDGTVTELDTPVLAGHRGARGAGRHGARRRGLAHPGAGRAPGRPGRGRDRDAAPAARPRRRPRRSSRCPSTSRSPATTAAPRTRSSTRPRTPSAPGPRASCRRSSSRSTAVRRPRRRRCFSTAVQYWTSRGFAVVDVNYGGSTGYGRAFREELLGQWGIVDVADCLAAARHLARTGRVDGERLTIRGGSAGGFTTLAALARDDTPFAAGADLLRRRRPRSARPRHPQVREPLPRPARRPVPGRRATSTSSGRRSTTSTASPGR